MITHTGKPWAVDTVGTPPRPRFHAVAYQVTAANCVRWRFGCVFVIRHRGQLVEISARSRWARRSPTASRAACQT